MTLTVNDANQSKLVLAHYVSTGDAPHLESGYRDGSGGFHPVAAGDIDEVFAADSIISSTITVTIAIDFDAIRTGETKYWSGSAGSRVYSDGTNSYTEADVTALFDGKSVKVGVKPSSSSRGRIFKSTAVSGNPVLGDLVTGDKVTISTVDYASLGTVLLTGINEENPKTTDNSVKYYVWGGDDTGTVANDGEGFDVSFDAAIEQVVAG